MIPSTGHASESACERELAQTIRRHLLPQAFPLRREIEFAAALKDVAATTCYYDTLWLDDHTVAIALAEHTIGGIEGAMRAAASKALLRAALTTCRSAAATLATCRNIKTFGATDAAVLVVDLHTATATAAAQGRAGLFADDGTPMPTGELSLTPATTLRLVISDRNTVPATTRTATASMSDLARRTLRDTTGAHAVAAVLYQRAARPSSIETAVFANNLDEIPRAQAWLERFCEQRAIGPEIIAGFGLVLDEILTNLISYAFRDGALHMIDVEASVTNGEFAIEVHDNGVAFNPLKLPPPALDAGLDEREIGGLGVHLMKSVADTVTYRREKGWNILRLCKTMDDHGNRES